MYMENPDTGVKSALIIDGLVEAQSINNCLAALGLLVASGFTAVAVCLAPVLDLLFCVALVFGFGAAGWQAGCTCSDYLCSTGNQWGCDQYESHDC